MPITLHLMERSFSLQAFFNRLSTPYPGHRISSMARLELLLPMNSRMRSTTLVASTMRDESSVYCIVALVDDSTGRLRDWWTNSTVKGFEERAQCVSKQYSQYYVLDEAGNKVYVNGNVSGSLSAST
jgi:hypothetical protein